MCYLKHILHIKHVHSIRVNTMGTRLGHSYMGWLVAVQIFKYFGGGGGGGGV